MKSRYRTIVNGGFTLIELLVAVSIISMLSSIVLASVSGAREKAQIIKFVQEMDSVRKAILIYRSNHNDQLPPCPNPISGSIGPISCFDLWGLSYYEQALQPIIDEGYISNIPHFPKFPQSAQYNEGSPYTYLYYLPSYYNGGPQGNGVREWSCTAIDYADWSPGFSAGAIIIMSTYDLPFSKGFTACEQGATGYCDSNVQLMPTGDPYCISLDY